MKKKPKKKKTPRIPLDALRKLGSRPITTKKGEKGYKREKAKEETEKMMEEEEEEK
jgi:hypothetical protein